MCSGAHRGQNEGRLRAGQAVDQYGAVPVEKVGVVHDNEEGTAASRVAERLQDRQEPLEPILGSSIDAGEQAAEGTERNG